MILKKISSQMVGDNSLVFMKELEFLLQSSTNTLGIQIINSNIGSGIPKEL